MNAISLHPTYQGRSSFFQGILSLFHTFHLRALRATTRATVAQPTSSAHRYGPPRPIYGPKAFTPVQSETPQLVARPAVKAQPCADKWPALRPIYGNPSANAHLAEATPAESEFSLWYSFEEEAPEVLTEEADVPLIEFELLRHKYQSYAS